MADTGHDRAAAATSPQRGVDPSALVKRDSRGRAVINVESRKLPDGRLWVDDPSPMRDMPPARRLRRILGVLEAAALAGDVSAARSLIEHARWAHEVRHGKPATRVEVGHTGSIAVIDSLGAPVAGAAIQAATGSALAAAGLDAAATPPPAESRSGMAHRRQRRAARGVWTLDPPAPGSEADAGADEAGEGSSTLPS